MKEKKTTLSDLDVQKRETLRTLAAGSVFAIPVIASFTMNELKLQAQSSPINGNFTS